MLVRHGPAQLFPHYLPLVGKASLESLNRQPNSKYNSRPELNPLADTQHSYKHWSPRALTMLCAARESPARPAVPNDNTKRASGHPPGAPEVTSCEDH